MIFKMEYKWHGKVIVLFLCSNWSSVGGDSLTDFLCAFLMEDFYGFI